MSATARTQAPRHLWSCCFYTGDMLMAAGTETTGSHMHWTARVKSNSGGIRIFPETGWKFGVPDHFPRHSRELGSRLLLGQSLPPILSTQRYLPRAFPPPGWPSAALLSTCVLQAAAWRCCVTKMPPLSPACTPPLQSSLHNCSYPVLQGYVLMSLSAVSRTPSGKGSAGSFIYPESWGLARAWHPRDTL